MDNDTEKDVQRSEGANLPKYGHVYRLSSPAAPPQREPDAPPNHYFDSEGNIRTDRRKTDRRFNRFVAAVLILCVLGAPLAGLGIGVGIRFFDRYLMGVLLSDNRAREDFAFANVHTPLATQNFGELDLPTIVDLVKPSTVLITAIGATRSGNFGFGGFAPNAGTGIIMYETPTRLYIATNAHVIENAQSVTVSIDGSPPIPAVPVGRNDAADLAVIAVYKFEVFERGIYFVQVARFGDSDIMRVGDAVVAIGNSMGEGNTVTNGIVSALDRDIRVEGRSLRVLQTNAAINRGNSGGPLVNMFGEVIGINTAKFAEELAEGMGYAIPSAIAKPILENIMHEYQAEPQRPMIGVRIGTVTPSFVSWLTDMMIGQGYSANDLDIPAYGAWISTITPDSPAERAGLMLYDIVTAVNGEPITGGQDFIDILSTLSVGDTVLLTVHREGLAVLEIPVTLGPHIRAF